MWGCVSVGVLEEERLGVVCEGCEGEVGLFKEEMGVYGECGRG